MFSPLSRQTQSFRKSLLDGTAVRYLFIYISLIRGKTGARVCVCVSVDRRGSYLTLTDKCYKGERFSQCHLTLTEKSYKVESPLRVTEQPGDKRFADSQGKLSKISLANTSDSPQTPRLSVNLRSLRSKKFRLSSQRTPICT